MGAPHSNSWSLQTTLYCQRNPRVPPFSCPCLLQINLVLTVLCFDGEEEPSTCILCPHSGIKMFEISHLRIYSCCSNVAFQNLGHCNRYSVVFQVLINRNYANFRKLFFFLLQKTVSKMFRVGKLELFKLMHLRKNIPWSCDVAYCLTMRLLFILARIVIIGQQGTLPKLCHLKAEILPSFRVRSTMQI